MKNLIYTLTVLLSVAFLSSCEVIEDLKPSKEGENTTGTTQPEKSDYIDDKAIDLMNQAYGTDQLQKYDIHIPARRSYTKTKVVIILHGGSWKELDKGFMKNYVSEIKSKGDNWVIVNANYRLTFQNGIKYDDQLQDIRTLINKLLSMRTQYQFSDKIYFIGASAGGHLAMSYSFTVDMSKYVKGVSVIAAPTDLTSAKIRVGEFGQDIEKLIGKSYNDAPESYRRASPRFQVNRASPPVILFYGGKDDLIPSDQGELLVQQLKANAVINSYNFYPEQGHEWMILSETMDKTLAFFGDNNTRQ